MATHIHLKNLHSRTWLAVKGKAAPAICSDLALRASMPVTRPRHFALEGAMSDAGWYVIVADGWNHRLIQPPMLTALSAWCEVLTCTADERNLSSAATGWREGRRLWSISYEGEESPGVFATEGELPPALIQIRKELTAASEAEDAGDLLVDPLFEIPIETVRQATGYRPDQASPAFDGRFVLLEATDPTLKQRLFGG
jgi:hypothetical protein